MRPMVVAAIAALCLAVTPAQAHTYRHHPAGNSRHHPVKVETPTTTHKRPPVRAPQKPLPNPIAIAGNVLDAAAKALGNLLQGWRDPIIVKQRPYHFIGQLAIGNLTVDFGTGGEGRGSIPYGDYEIKRTSDDSVGPWGKKHGAFGLSTGEIEDHQQGFTRDGIEIHKAEHLLTAGCVAIVQWDQAKKAILAMMDEEGTAFLHVWPGIFEISSQPHIGRPVIVMTEPQRFAGGEEHHHKPHPEAEHRHSHHHYAHNEKAAPVRGG